MKTKMICGSRLRLLLKRMNNDQNIIELRKIFKEEFGINLSVSEATEKANHLLNLFQVLVTKPSKLDKACKGSSNED